MRVRHCHHVIKIGTLKARRPQKLKQIGTKLEQSSQSENKLPGFQSSEDCKAPGISQEITEINKLLDETIEIFHSENLEYKSAAKEKMKHLWKLKKDLR